MIQKIQPFTVQDRGTATESKIEVQSRYTTQNKAVIYYDLRDPNGTTPAFDSRTNEWVTLPYRILSYKRIIVTGNDRNNAISDTNLAIDIIFRERPDIVKKGGIKGIFVGVSGRDPKEACQLYSEGLVKELFIDDNDFTLATQLTSDIDMKEPVQEPVYVAGDGWVRYWNGKRFDETFIDAC